MEIVLFLGYFIEDLYDYVQWKAGNIFCFAFI